MVLRLEGGGGKLLHYRSKGTGIGKRGRGDADELRTCLAQTYQLREGGFDVRGCRGGHGLYDQVTTTGI